jgi:hypothetical protein
MEWFYGRLNSCEALREMEQTDHEANLGREIKNHDSRRIEQKRKNESWPDNPTGGWVPSMRGSPEGRPQYGRAPDWETAPVNRALLDRHEQLMRAVAQQQIEAAQRENEEKRTRPVTGPQDSAQDSAARSSARHRPSPSTSAQGKNPDLCTGQNNERLKSKSKTNEKPVAPCIHRKPRAGNWGGKTKGKIKQLTQKAK